MKKLLFILPLLLLLVGCEEEADVPTIDDIIVGTWSVTTMGTFANDDCSGAMDYTEWGLAQAFGITISFNFKAAGTVDMTVTGFGKAETETLDWTATDDQLCIDGECMSFTLSNDDKTLKFVDSEDAYCEDMSGEEVDLNQTECGTAGNDWYEAVCYEYTMTK